MSLKLKKILKLEGAKLKFDLWWIEVRYGIWGWFLQKTAKWRLKHSKKLILSSMAYYNSRYEGCWDDVDINDQWGFWLPYGFGICSKDMFDFDNKINQDMGAPLDVWEDVVASKDWTTYYFKDAVLEAKHYFTAARRHLKKELGDASYDKDIELRIFVESQKWMDEDLHKEAEWIKSGKPPFKVSFTDQAKEDFKGLFGEKEAGEMFKTQEERNKKIEEEERRKRLEDQGDISP